MRVYSKNLKTPRANLVFLFVTTCIHEPCVTFLLRAVTTGTSVILIIQNFIHQAPHCCDISLNGKYLVALKRSR